MYYLLWPAFLDVTWDMREHGFASLMLLVFVRYRSLFLSVIFLFGALYVFSKRHVDQSMRIALALPLMLSIIINGLYYFFFGELSLDIFYIPFLLYPAYLGASMPMPPYRVPPMRSGQEP